MFGFILAILNSYGALTISHINLWLVAQDHSFFIGPLLIIGMVSQTGAASLTFKLGRKNLFLAVTLLVISSLLLIIAVKTQIVLLFFIAQPLSAFVNTISLTKLSEIFRGLLGDKRQHGGHTLSAFANTSLNAVFYSLSLRYLDLEWSAFGTLLILTIVWVGVVILIPFISHFKFSYPINEVKESPLTLRQIWIDHGFRFGIGNVGSISASFALPIMLPLALEKERASLIVLIVGLIGGVLVALLAWLGKLDTDRTGWVLPLIAFSRVSQLIGFICLVTNQTWIAMIFLILGQANMPLTATVIFNRSPRFGVSSDALVTNAAGLFGNLVGTTIGGLYGYQLGLAFFVPLIASSFVASLAELLRR
ncbi:hypothetical protein SAMN05444392_106126 [Seinonella peptonophila]|uniref:Major Facilitator Superfamily protein n=1 Tax=Seinonella peptonophila TaxID=112248 RepID=A0A1M4YA89_9BACL|nr:hypothetical protein SAMN05444392_106126 [Seinonella peptonophila]